MTRYVKNVTRSGLYPLYRRQSVNKSSQVEQLKPEMSKVSEKEVHCKESSINW